MNEMYFDEIPIADNGTWELYRVDIDEETYETVLIGPCGEITHRESEDELPTQREQYACWLRYYRSVMETGDDPLDLVYTPNKKEVHTDERWQCAFKDSIIGVVMRTRKNGRGPWLIKSAIPIYVAEYMELDRNSSIMDRREIRNVEHLGQFDAINFEKRPPRGFGKFWVWSWVIIPRTTTITESDASASRRRKRLAKQAYEGLSLEYERLLEKEM